MVVPAAAPAQRASGSPADASPDHALRSAGFLGASARLAEPGAAPTVPTTRPRVAQPPTASGSAWKKPKSTVAGYATFYDNGTTAMRLPRGTVVRICGGGGCIERTVTDYGPVKPSRVVDMDRADFFGICGCPSWAGSTWVTVSIY